MMTKPIFGLMAFIALLFFVSTSQGESFSVDIEDGYFDIDDLVISEGDTVVWRNVDDHATNHTVTSSDNSSTGGPIFDSGNLTYNQTFSFTFNNSGVYNYTDLNDYFSAYVYVASDSFDGSAIHELWRSEYDGNLTIYLWSNGLQIDNLAYPEGKYINLHALSPTTVSQVWKIEDYYAYDSAEQEYFLQLKLESGNNTGLTANTSYEFDVWEWGYWNYNSTWNQDSDNDILSDGEEYFGWEDYYGDIHITDRFKADTDGDNLTDYEEGFGYNSSVWYITNPNDPDTDDDGLNDGYETFTSDTDPTDSDSDDDNLNDGDEVLVYGSDPNDWDTDGDDLSDGDEVNGTYGFVTSPTDYDTDDDYLWDGDEYSWGTNATNNDTDEDQLLDGAEVYDYDTSPTDSDTDDDGLSDGYEVFTSQTDPNEWDTDDDWLNDYDELYNSIWGPTDPNDSDSDDDGLHDGREVYDWGTDPNDTDTDDDDLTDGAEVDNYGTNPTNNDTDDDRLLDGSEVYYWETDPNEWDTDEDWLGDGAEVLDNGTDPNDRDSDDDYLMDGPEVDWFGTDPLDADTDDDGLSDADEIGYYNFDVFEVDIIDGTFDNNWTGDFTLGSWIDVHNQDNATYNLTIVEHCDHEDCMYHNEFVDPDNFFSLFFYSAASYTISFGNSTDNSTELSFTVYGDEGYGTDALNDDTDDDLLYDGSEVYNTTWGPTDPLNSDTDEGGRTDGQEVLYDATDPLDISDDMVDSDGDGITDWYEENVYGTDSNDWDTDWDDINDYDEIFVYGTDPTDWDSDYDNLADGDEIFDYGTDPLDQDTDDDGIPDGFEVDWGTDPKDTDTDDDGLSDLDEIGHYSFEESEIFIWNSSFTPLIVFSCQEGSDGVYHIDVIRVNGDNHPLEDYSFFLKDETGSTYVGAGHGFGEVAMQIVGGEEHGIDMAYGGDDEQLQNRATNVSNDDGSEYPVHFNDNDRDGKLSAGDQFLVYGNGNAASGPAADNWRLDIQFDASGDIIGSAKML